MSNPAGNSGCGKRLLYLVAVLLGLRLGHKLLSSLYVAFSYAGLNTLLALDLSAYGRVAADYWPGWALLGLGLGAAGGAIAAQHRFGLSRGVGVAGWLAITLLLGLVYATVEVGAASETTTTVVAPPPAPKGSGRVSAAHSKRRRTHRSPASDTSSIAVDDWRQVVVRMAPLRANRADSLARPTAYLRQGDTVHLLRRARRWARVVSGRGSAGWVRLAGLGSVAKEPLPPVAQEETTTAAEQLTTANQPDIIAPARPIGHHQYTGQLNNLAVTYALDWQPDGELSGNYSFDQQPGTVYRLTGTLTTRGELHLLEFTQGRQSARCVLQRQGNGYAGTMRRTDGRQVAMSFE